MLEVTAKILNVSRRTYRCYFSPNRALVCLGLHKRLAREFFYLRTGSHLEGNQRDSVGAISLGYVERSPRSSLDPEIEFLGSFDGVGIEE